MNVVLRVRVAPNQQEDGSPTQKRLILPAEQSSDSVRCTINHNRQVTCSTDVYRSLSRLLRSDMVIFPACGFSTWELYFTVLVCNVQASILTYSF